MSMVFPPSVSGDALVLEQAALRGEKLAGLHL